VDTKPLSVEPLAFANHSPKSSSDILDYAPIVQFIHKNIRKQIHIVEPDDAPLSDDFSKTLVFYQQQPIILQQSSEDT
jgi:hypothetical protein